MSGFDLHTHSTCSDGTLEPEQVAELAATRGLAGIALTDHDTADGVERARQAGRERGLEVLTGCELSAEHLGNPVHVLAYGFDPAEPRFAAKRAWIRDGRVERARQMVERLRALAAELGLETTGSSDCHGALYGYRLGVCRTPEATVAALLARAG